jgi:hypothetical protein
LLPLLPAVHLLARLSPMCVTCGMCRRGLGAVALRDGHKVANCCIPEIRSVAAPDEVPAME